MAIWPATAGPADSSHTTDSPSSCEHTCSICSDGHLCCCCRWLLLWCCTYRSAHRQRGLHASDSWTCRQQSHHRQPSESSCEHTCSIRSDGRLCCCCRWLLLWCCTCRSAHRQRGLHTDHHRMHPRPLAVALVVVAAVLHLPQHTSSARVALERQLEQRAPSADAGCTTSAPSTPCEPVNRPMRLCGMAMRHLAPPKLVAHACH